jgi:hypothetical protein
MSSAVTLRSVRAGVLTALLALLLPVLAVSSASPASANSCDASATGAGYGGGGGTTGPYLICSAAHIAHLAETPGDWGKEFLQTANITMPAPSGTPAVNHTPIGAGFDDAFTGVYDGGGFEIRGLVIDGMPVLAFPIIPTGFFGATRGATLTGIHLVDADVRSRGNDVGSLVGRAFATLIKDSSVAGTSRVEGNGFVGGLVGAAAGADGGETELSNVSSTADVFGVFEVGGLIGGTSPNSEPMYISDASATGDVVATGNKSGGLAGQLSGVVIVRSFATGDVTSDGFNVGGLAGEADRDSTIIADSYATGAVEATTADADGDARIGGLVGVIANPGVKIERSYATGGVTAPSGAGRVGGLVGTREVSSNTGPVTDFVAASFWDMDTSSQSDSGGGSGAVGRSTAQMKRIGTFADAGWAIVSGGSGGPSDVWGICPGVNGGYPFLLRQPIGADCPASTSRAAAPSFVAPGGVVPSLSAGVGEWVQADGSSTPLTVSSPGANQVRYVADGVQVTFTGGSGSGVSNGLVANPNGEIVCEVCVALAAGQVIEVWMFSTPRLVAAHLTEDLPCQRFSVPVVAPLDGGGPVSAGAHTLQLALPTAQGMQAVNVGVTVGGPVPGSVPAGEGPTVPVGLVALGLLAAAGGLLAARRPVVTG